jgi:hypothetical protein
MLDESGIPIPATDNNWSPVEFFNPDSFSGSEEFLVWIESDAGSSCFVAQWDETYNGEGLVVRPKGFTGEWRHIESLADVEPVAFRAMPEGPNPDRLKQIVAAHPGYKHAA